MLSFVFVAAIDALLLVAVATVVIVGLVIRLLFGPLRPVMLDGRMESGANPLASEMKRPQQSSPNLVFIVVVFVGTTTAL